MIKINLLRTESGEHGTFGGIYFEFDVKPSFYALEPPWKNNTPNLSCIPSGEYICKMHYSRKYKWVYSLINVKDRSAILIHWGCYGGDSEKGLKTNTLGCILMGLRRGVLKGQKVILNTRKAIRQFNKKLQGKTFLLNIINLY